MSRNVIGRGRRPPGRPRSRRAAAVAVAVAALAAAWPGAVRAGEVRGTIRWKGAVPPPAPPVEVTKDRAVCGESASDDSLVVADGGVANVVVRVVVPGARVEPGRATLDQQRCRFVPHVLAVTVGSTLDVLNGDDLLHGVHGRVGPVTAFNVPMPYQGQKKSQVLARPGMIRVGCDVHDWMSAWVAVLDVPHFAVTDARGRFAIPDVPPGTWTAIAWHERFGERVGSVTVPATGAATLDLSYPGESRSP